MRRERGRRLGSSLAALGFALLAVGCSDSGHVRTLDRWSLAPGGSTRTRDVTIPIHLTADDVPDEETVYALRATVRIPSAMRGRPLWFVAAQLPTRTVLVVDGEQATPVVEKPWETAWVAGPQVFAIPEAGSEDGLLHLEWRIAHDWPLSRWHDRAPELRTAGSVGRAAVVTQATSFYLATILFGALLAAALSCFAAILVDRRDKDSRWMLATSIATLPFSMFQMGTLQYVVPRAYEFAFTLITLSIACFLLGRFLTNRFGLETTTRPFTVVFTASVVMAFVLRDRPFDSVIVQESLGAACELLATVPPTFLLLRGRARHNLSDVRWTTFALVFCTVLAVPDILYFTGLGDYLGGGHVTLVGVLVVVMTIVQLLARKRVRELTEANAAAEAHATELRDEHARLGVLRAELELQMSAGKSGLLEAVAAISSNHAPKTNLGPGDVVDDRYRVVCRLGVGGMGAVFEVARISDGSRFALKTAHDLDGPSLARLAREALIGANVRSDSIIEVVDIGVAREGFLFLVMELFESSPLSESKSRFGDASWAIRVLGGVVRALDAVHSAGVVHRDLKPSNILLGLHDDAVVKLADFGISRFADYEAERQASAPRLARISDLPPTASPLRDAEAKLGVDAPMTQPSGSPSNPDALPDLTNAGQIAGTIGYLAPEAMTSDQPTRSWDVFAFGVIAYLVLTGERPDPSRDLSPGATNEDRFPKLVERVRGIDRGLLEALDACRSLEACDRPTSIDLLRAFERVGS